MPTISPANPLKDSRSEKQVEASGDRLMMTLGFTVIRFSQPRASMQTPGIPDRRYYRARDRERRLVPNAWADYILWWEAKREGGKQSPAQRAFQELVRSCGEEYISGTDAQLLDWCKAKGLCR